MNSAITIVDYGVGMLDVRERTQVPWLQWAQALLPQLPWLPRPVSGAHTVPGSVSVLDTSRV